MMIQNIQRILFCSEKLKKELYEKEEEIKNISLKSLLNLQDSLIPIVPLHHEPSKFSPEMLIRYTTTQIYKEKIEQLTLLEVPFPLALKAEFIQYPTESLTHVILPSLFAKDVLIRPPLPSESDKIFKKFDDRWSIRTDYNFITSTIKNEGILEDNDRIARSMVASKGKNGNKFLGSIFFEIVKVAKPFCKLDKLLINENCYGQGLGTLLTIYAILEAKQCKCDRIELQPSLEGLPCYLSLGFIPDKEVASDPKWGTLSILQKAKIINKLDLPDLYLNLNEANFKNVLKRLHQVLNAPPRERNLETKSPSNYLDFRNVSIPKYFKKLLKSDDTSPDSSEMDSDFSDKMDIN